MHSPQPRRLQQKWQCKIHTQQTWLHEHECYKGHNGLTLNYRYGTNIIEQCVNRCICQIVILSIF